MEWRVFGPDFVEEKTQRETDARHQSRSTLSVRGRTGFGTVRGVGGLKFFEGFIVDN